MLKGLCFVGQERKSLGNYETVFATTDIPGCLGKIKLTTGTKLQVLETSVSFQTATLLSDGNSDASSFCIVYRPVDCSLETKIGPNSLFIFHFAGQVDVFLWTPVFLFIIIFI